MEKYKMMSRISKLIEETKVGILATTCKEGAPHTRWMTPAILKGRPGAIFAVTSPGTGKTIDLETNEKVQWMFQNSALSEIVRVAGRVNILDNPAIEAEVLEAIGKRLTFFWDTNLEKTSFLVLETIVEEAEYFLPMKGIKETVKFE